MTSPYNTIETLLPEADLFASELAYWCEETHQFVITGYVTTSPNKQLDNIPIIHI